MSTALERLLRAPASHFLPPKLQLSTSRLLLFLSLDPAFFSIHSLPSTSSSTFYPTTSANTAVDIARQGTTFRRGVLLALKALSEQGGNAAGGVQERCAEVWRRGCVDGDEEVRFDFRRLLRDAHGSLLTFPRFYRSTPSRMPL